MVKDELEGKEITAEPVSLNVTGKEERVWTVMRSMQDSRTVKTVIALQQVGIRLTNGEFERMGSGFIFGKDYPWNSIARFLYDKMPEGFEVIVAEIGCYKMGSDVSVKDKVMVGTRFTEKQMHAWLSTVKPAASGEVANPIEANKSDKTCNVSKRLTGCAWETRDSTCSRARPRCAAPTPSTWPGRGRRCTRWTGR